MEHLSYNTIITDFIGRNISVNKINGYNLYVSHTENGEFVLYVVKDGFAEVLGRSYGNMTYDAFFKDFDNFFFEFKEEE